MRRIFIICAVLLMFAVKVSASSLHEIPGVAVLPYSDKTATSGRMVNSEGASVLDDFRLGDASKVTEFVIEKLKETDRFKVLEREHLQDAAQELAYAMGGMVTPSTVMSAGKQIGAQFLIAGSITSLATKPSGIDVTTYKAGGGFNKMSVVANITMRFIDVETGEIVLAASGVGESARTKAEFTLNRQSEETYETDDDEGYIYEETETTDSNIKITIGAQDYSLVQVQNALFKAVGDTIYNKNYGVLAKMDGKSKRKKV